MKRNFRLMSTLKINFDHENMSDASIDSQDFQNCDEYSEAKNLNSLKNAQKNLVGNQ